MVSQSRLLSKSSLRLATTLIRSQRFVLTISLAIEVVPGLLYLMAVESITALKRASNVSLRSSTSKVICYLQLVIQ